MSAAERRWLTTAGLVVGLLALLPYLVAELFPPPGLRFVGAFWSSYDLAQYLATMREGAASSSWLVHDHLSPEPHAPALIYPFYVALGKLAATLRWSDEAMLRLAEIGARFVLVVAVYRFAAGLLKETRARQTALALTVLGAGFGPLAAALLSLTPFPPETLGLDATFVELSTFILLFASPHLMLGLALSLAVVRVAVVRSPGFQPPLMVFGCMLCIGLTNPFGVPATLLALGLHAALLLLHHRLGRAGVVLGLSALGGALPTLLYYGFVFSADPFWGVTYGKQNVLPTPPLAGLVLGLGPVGLLALWGARGAARAHGLRGQLLVAWATAALLLAYGPVPFQRRLLFGLQPVLAVLAAPVLVDLLGRLSRFRLASGPQSSRLAGVTGRLGLLWLMGSGALSAYAGLLLGPLLGATDAPAHFQPAPLWQVRAWLAPRLGPGETVLAEPRDANVLAGGVDGRVFFGHGVATLEPASKRRDLAEFFDVATHEDARARLLEEYCVGYVLESPRSRALGQLDLDTVPLLEPAFTTGELVLHGVRDTEPGCAAGAQTHLAGVTPR